MSDELDYILTEPYQRGYQKGRADGYSQAESDYFAQSQKNREDTYNCGYAIGRAEAIDDVIKLVESENCAYFEWESDGLIDKLESLKEKKDGEN